MHPQRPMRIAVLGCGAMGAALVRGLELARPAPAVIALAPDPDLAKTRLGDSAAHVTKSRREIDSFRPQVVIIAVKPQKLRLASHEFAPLTKDRIVVSLAAGVKSAELRGLFPKAAGVFRAMPNLAVAHGRGMTVLVAEPTDDEPQLAIVEAMMASTGQTARVTSDAQMDIATAISGAGPAYFFALAEAMAAAGERLGLDPSLSGQLAAQTLAGAGVMSVNIEQVSAMKRAVQSPGGTTAAALAVLEGPSGIVATVADAVEAAVTRARELAR